MYKKKQKGKKIDEEPLRRLMCHSDYTARKWYLRDSLTDQAAEAAEQIKSFTKPSPKKRAPACDEQEDREITGDRFRWCCALRHVRTQFDVREVVLNNVQLEYLSMEVPMLKPYFYGVVACDRLPKKPAQVLLLLNC